MPSGSSMFRLASPRTTLEYQVITYPQTPWSRVTPHEFSGRCIAAKIASTTIRCNRFPPDGRLRHLVRREDVTASRSEVGSSRFHGQHCSKAVCKTVFRPSPGHPHFYRSESSPPLCERRMLVGSAECERVHHLLWCLEADSHCTQYRFHPLEVRLLRV